MIPGKVKQEWIKIEQPNQGQGYFTLHSTAEFNNVLTAVKDSLQITGTTYRDFRVQFSMSKIKYRISLNNVPP